jgi:hypothetical protein
VVSARLAESAGIHLSAAELREFEIRGRRRPLRVRLVPDARALPVASVGERRSHNLVRNWWPMLAARRRTLDARSSRAS